MPQYRKSHRLQNFDYNQNGACFITICTQNRRPILSRIDGTNNCPIPCLTLLPHGEIADRYIRQMANFYDHLSVENYVIMPDHIHLLIRVDQGQSGTPVPTKGDRANSAVAKFVSTFKRFCNKEYGENIWQPRFYDHVIRNQQDYDETWQYIQNNPHKWMLTHRTL